MELAVAINSGRDRQRINTRSHLLDSLIAGYPERTQSFRRGSENIIELSGNGVPVGTTKRTVALPENFMEDGRRLSNFFEDLNKISRVSTQCVVLQKATNPELTNPEVMGGWPVICRDPLLHERAPQRGKYAGEKGRQRGMAVPAHNARDDCGVRQR